MSRLAMRWWALAGLLATAACEPRAECSGEYCGTLVFLHTGGPDILLPPVTQQANSRDIHDQIFLKLADLGLSGNTVGDEDFVPLLAERWEWDGPLTLVFHLNPRARWQDGRPVTAADVAFTFDAYNDPRVGSPYASALRSISAVTPRDSLTAVFRFRRRYPEMFYDAVYHMRILPAHLLHATPREQWVTAPFGHAPVGNGPYRFVEWRANERVELVADSAFFLGRPHIRRLIFRVTPDQQVRVTQLVADQGDAVEFLGPPQSVQRVREAGQLALYPYKGSTYTFLGFNLVAPDDTSAPHPVFGDREVRRALAMATDRARLLRSALGDLAKVPPGPVSQLQWIWDLEIRALPYDTAQASRRLASRGWRDSDGDGVRDRDGQKLSFRLLVPTTSAIRRQYARLLQEQYRPLGVDVQIDEVEGTVFAERAKAGRFDAALPAWSTDASPGSGMAQTWTSAGIGGSNYGRYVNPVFERLLEQATLEAPGREQARRAWLAALEVINQDAPGIWLYSPDMLAAVHRRVADVQIRPDSWWALVRNWRILPDQLIDRDRVER